MISRKDISYTSSFEEEWQAMSDVIAWLREREWEEWQQTIYQGATAGNLGKRDAEITQFMPWPDMDTADTWTLRHSS